MARWRAVVDVSDTGVLHQFSRVHIERDAGRVGGDGEHGG